MSAVRYPVRVAEGWGVYDGESQRGGGEVVGATEEQVVAWGKAGCIERRVPPREEWPEGCSPIPGYVEDADDSEYPEDEQG